MWIDVVDPRFADFREAAVVASRDPLIRALAIKLCGMYDVSPSREVGRMNAADDTRAIRSYQAAQLLRAVQRRVDYVDSEEGFQHPLTTWLVKQGDCKLSAPLLAGLALSVGIPARMLALGWNGEPSHVVTQLAPFGVWLWAETTIPGARLGEHPSAALERLGDGGRERRDLAGGVHGSEPATEVGSTLRSALHANAREILRSAYWETVGREPSVFERQVIQALCYTETSYGRGWTGPCEACKDSHNWGSVHARTRTVELFGQTLFEVCEENCCACSDTFPDGKRYRQPMRVYHDDVKGAGGVLDLIYHHMGASARALEEGSSVEAVAKALFYDHYYGGYCNNALRAFGDAAKESYAFPPSVSHLAYGERAKTAAGKACEREAIGMATERLFRAAKEIALSLGEPVPSRGGDSSIWWLLGGAVVAGVAYARRRSS